MVLAVPIVRLAPARLGPAAALALVCLVAAGLTGCGRGFGRDDAVDAFQEAHPETSSTEAGCVVDRLIDRYGIDGLADELETGDPSPGFSEAQFTDMFACGIDGDVTAELTRQLTGQLTDAGIDGDDATCVAGSLAAELDDGDIEVLVSGDITDEYLAKFTAAMEDCGALR